MSADSVPKDLNRSGGELFQYARFLQNQEKHRSRRYLVAAASDFFPAALHNALTQGLSFWSLLPRDVFGLSSSISPAVLHQLYGASPHSDIGLDRTLESYYRGVCYQQGLMSAPSPDSVQQAFREGSSHPICVERESLKLPPHRCLEPYLQHLFNTPPSRNSEIAAGQIPAMYLSFAAGALARCYLIPVLAMRTVPPDQFFDGLFAAHVAATRGHPHSCYLFAEVLRLCFRKPVETTRKYYETAAEGGVFEACAFLHALGVAPYDAAYMKEFAITSDERAQLKTGRCFKEVSYNDYDYLIFAGTASFPYCSQTFKVTVIGAIALYSAPPYLSYSSSHQYMTFTSAREDLVKRCTNSSANVSITTPALRPLSPVPPSLTLPVVSLPPRPASAMAALRSISSITLAPSLDVVPEHRAPSPILAQTLYENAWPQIDDAAMEVLPRTVTTLYENGPSSVGPAASIRLNLAPSVVILPEQPIREARSFSMLDSPSPRSPHASPRSGNESSLLRSPSSSPCEPRSGRSSSASSTNLPLQAPPSPTSLQPLSTSTMQSSEALRAHWRSFIRSITFPAATCSYTDDILWKGVKGIRVLDSLPSRPHPAYACQLCGMADRGIMLYVGDKNSCVPCFASTVSLSDVTLKCKFVTDHISFNSQTLRALNLLFSDYGKLYQLACLCVICYPRDAILAARTRGFHTSLVAGSALLRQEAVAQLPQRGSFLLRLSSVPGALTLSCGLGDGKAYHHRIGRTDSGNFIMRLPKSGAKEGEEEREFAILWEALGEAIRLLELDRPAGPSPYRGGIPAQEVDPWIMYNSSRAP